MAAFIPFINILLNIWSHLPFFALTDDNDYLNVIIKDKHAQVDNGKPIIWRFSLVNLIFGEEALQLITFTSRGFEPKKIRKLSWMPDYVLTDEKIEGLLKNYREHLLALSDEDKAIEKEGLIYQIDVQQHRIDTSYTKLNIFYAVIFALIPTVVDFLNNEYNLVGRVIFFILIYCTAELVILLLQTIHVRAISKGRFADIKTQDEHKEDMLMLNYYYDWQETKRSADLMVSYVSIVQDWIVAIMLLIGILLLFPGLKDSAPRDPFEGVIWLYGGVV